MMWSIGTGVDSNDDVGTGLQARWMLGSVGLGAARPGLMAGAVLDVAVARS